MQENVNRRKRNGHFLCEDEIHLRAVSKNATNQAQLEIHTFAPDPILQCVNY